ncbi:membrane protein [Arenicella chitinivorans]|uniref:Membrane protein n=1 Tax=Arenicella chitinivorans TaxID=1329800 RepID=A0A918VMX0_9GAMM|nr:tetratricopeptide repeat protein [Arenicella chitinivorans]GHA09212.1 membrane protein [Arenicella chitinivorans]
MADDIFLTPEEQDERARQWLKDNGPALIVGVVLGLGAIFGWDYYKTSQLEKAQAASTIYAATVAQVTSSELADVSTKVDQLKSDYAATPYAAKAVLIKARQLAQSDLDAAFTELQWVIDNAKESGLVHTARVRQAKIRLEQGDLDAAKQLASHQPSEAFTSHYSEVLGDIAVEQGEYTAARAYYQAAVDGLVEGQSAYAQVLSLKLERLPEAESVSADDQSASE